MTKPITLKPIQWTNLRSRLTEDYGRGVMLIRSRMRDKLGFTVREHRSWSAENGYTWDIRLDFYDEPKRTMFLIKYSAYLGRPGITDS
jgi:hypothetical protein